MKMKEWKNGRQLSILPHELLFYYFCIQIIDETA